MQDKDPFISHVVSQWLSIAYTVAMAAVAGVVGYISRATKRGVAIEAKRVFAAFAIGGLNGYLMFLLCDAAEYSWQTTAFLTGAAGAIGREMLELLLNRAKKFIE